MENVTIQSVIAKKTGAKNGKPWTISEVTLSDGRKVDSFDSFVNGETVDVEIIPNANPQYNATMKKAKSAGQAHAANFKNAEVANKAIDYNNTKDLRITMLSCISSAATFYAERSTSLSGSPLKHSDILELASAFFNHATQEKDTLPF